MSELSKWLNEDELKELAELCSEFTRAQIRYGRDTIRGGCFLLQCPTLETGIEVPDCHYKHMHDGLGCPLTRNKPTKET